LHASSSSPTQGSAQHKDVWHAFVVHLRTWITEPDKKPMRPFSLLILNLTDARL